MTRLIDRSTGGRSRRGPGHGHASQRPQSRRRWANAEGDLAALDGAGGAGGSPQDALVPPQVPRTPLGSHVPLASRRLPHPCRPVCRRPWLQPPPARLQGRCLRLAAECASRPPWVPSWPPATAPTAARRARAVLGWRRWSRRYMEGRRNARERKKEKEWAEVSARWTRVAVTVGPRG